MNRSSTNSESGKLKIRNNIRPGNVDKLDKISSYNAWQQLKLFRQALNNQTTHVCNDPSEKSSEEPVPAFIPPYRSPPPYTAKKLRRQTSNVSQTSTIKHNTVDKQDSGELWSFYIHKIDPHIGSPGYKETESEQEFII